MNRRKYLAASGAGASAAIAGCLDRLEGAKGGEGGINGGDESGDEGEHEDDEVALPASCPDDDVDYRCGEGDPIEAYENFDDDEEVRYHDNGTVDFVYGTTGREPFYENVPFEEWAGFTCPSVGAREALSYTRARLENTDGLASGIGGPGEETGASFEVYTGDEADGPSDPVAFEEVVETAPAYVETTIALEDREYECAVPVYVETYDRMPTPD